MKQIVITGGNFINKGAQSMLFSLINHLKNEHPTIQITVLDLFPTQTLEEKQIYDFTILNMHVRTLYRIAFPWIKPLLKKSPKSDNETEIIKAIQNADHLYDISGYGPSSHNQSPLWTLATLLPIKLARSWKTPCTLLPQSLGPFDFTGWKKWFLFPALKNILQYPETIYAREPQGLEAIKKFRVKESRLAFDIVLQCDKIQPENIYRNNHNQATTPIANKIKNNIIIIPNKQLFKIWGEDATILFFQNIIKTILNQKEQCTLLQHATDDKELCEKIAKPFSDVSFNVITQTHSPMQLEQLIENSSAVISARYHGLIHSLKLNKSVFAVGWAVKYAHLMQSFNMETYLFQAEKEKPSSLSTDKIIHFIEKRAENQKIIAERLKEIKSSGIFKS